jgi:AraC-like DNA-binding protein/quercetin dioxygenase-like cupin family protein
MEKYNLDLLWKEDNFDIEYRKYDQGHSMNETHYHPHYEIYYQLKGDRYYFIKDRTYYIQEGGLVWLNAQELHKAFQAETAEGERILINLRKAFLANFPEQETSIFACFEDGPITLQLDSKQKKEIETLLEKLLEEKKRKKSNILYQQLLVAEFLILSRRYQKSAAKHDIPANVSVRHERIAKVAAYLGEHYKEKLTLEEVANKFYISPYHLSRTFKEGTGFTFIKYLSYIRVHHAKHLLERKEISVLNVAEAVGFDTLTHFERVFKEFTGTSPLKYRKSNREKEGNG